MIVFFVFEDSVGFCNAPFELWDSFFWDSWQIGDMNSMIQKTELQQQQMIRVAQNTALRFPSCYLTK